MTATLGFTKCECCGFSRSGPCPACATPEHIEATAAVREAANHGDLTLDVARSLAFPLDVEAARLLGVCLECGRPGTRPFDCIACQYDAGLDG